MDSFTLCFTGISGSGKSTLAKELSNRLKENGIKVQIIDGDILRNEMGQLFGYTYEERMKNSRVVRVLAKYLNDNGINVIIAIVAPYEQMRSQIREYIGKAYIEAYIQCPLEECAKRDVKGYYKESSQGKMHNLNGADDIYEVPHNSEVTINTLEEDIDSSVRILLRYLEEKKICHINI